MNNLDDLVLDIVLEFVKNNVLFTALDVSNKVKETMPFARHREVRDVVRSVFSTHIEPAGYAKTPITVNLKDGTTAEALLYHSLVDSWDLDNKYDAQQRSQDSVKQSVVTMPVTVTPPSQAPVVAPTVTPAKVNVPVSQPVSTQTSVREVWSQLFGTIPSLFPRK